jgi:hypothetical protein
VILTRDPGIIILRTRSCMWFERESADGFGEHMLNAGVLGFCIFKYPLLRIMLMNGSRLRMIYSFVVPQLCI